MRTLLITCLVAIMPVVAVAQSDRTCIAYMEADAEYGRVESETRESLRQGIGREYNDLLKAAFSEDELFVLQFVSEFEKGLILQDMLDRLTHAKRQPILNILNQMKTIMDNAIENATVIREMAYTDAYDGPTSSIESVMADLISKDRVRCQYRF